MPVCVRGEVALYYELSGAGLPVLWIQGVGVPAEGWRPQVERMQGIQSLIFDNRGLGRSTLRRGTISIEDMAEDACFLLDQVGWDSAHVVGHSMGGLIATEVALRHRHRVRSLSLLCTFSKGMEASRLTPRVLWMSLRTRIGTRASRRRAFLEMICTPEFLSAGDPATIAADLVPLMGRDLAEQPAILMRQVMAMGRYDRSAALSELAGTPTLVISAQHDPIAKTKYGRALATSIPGAKYLEIPAASHAVPIHAADQVNQLLQDFITGIG